MLEAHENFVNHEPQASDLRILLVFFQHPKWFIMPLTIETCGLYNNYYQKTRKISMSLLAQ